MVRHPFALMLLLASTIWRGQIGFSSASRSENKVSVANPVGGAPEFSENVLCAILHLQVPAQFWVSEASYISLQKTLQGLDPLKRDAARERAAELARTRQLKNLEMRREDVSDDEFQALNLLEAILELRRSQLVQLDRKFSDARRQPVFHATHSDLLKKEMAAVSAQLQQIQLSIDQKVKLSQSTLSSNATLGKVQKMLGDSQSAMDSEESAGTSTSPRQQELHRLRNVAELDSSQLYQQQMRDLRRRIERANGPQEKKVLRGQLATLYQQHRSTAHAAKRQSVYRTLKGETPRQVAELLGIDLDRLLVANAGNRPDLTPWTKMERGSPLIVPRVILHQAQQQVREHKLSSNQQAEEKKVINLHSDLLRAVENREYEEAAQIAAELHGGKVASREPAAPLGNTKSRMLVGGQSKTPTNDNTDNRKKGRNDKRWRITGGTQRGDTGTKKGTSNGVSETGPSSKTAADAKVMTIFVSCAACESTIRIANVHRDLGIQRLLENAVGAGLPSSYNALVYKGKIVPSHWSVKDLKIPLKNSNHVKMTAMVKQKRRSAPDPLGQRKTSNSGT